MKTIKAHSALFISNTIWAVGYPMYSTIMPSKISPMAMVTLSLCGTALIAWLHWIYLYIKGKTPSQHRVERGDIAKIAIAALLIGIVRKGFLIFGFSLTSTVDGSVIATMVPVMVFIISLLLGRERFSIVKITGLALAVAGVALIVATSSSAHRTTSSALGNILIIIEVIAMAIYIASMRPLFNKYSSATILRWAYTISAIIAIPIGYESVATTQFHALSWQNYAMLVYLVFLPTYLPNMLLNYALRSIESTIASLYGYLQPIIAITIAVCAGLDKLHWDSAIFALMMLAGISMVNLTTAPARTSRNR